MDKRLISAHYDPCPVLISLELNASSGAVSDGHNKSKYFILSNCAEGIAVMLAKG